MELKRCERCAAITGDLCREIFDCKKCNGTGMLLPDGAANGPTEYGPGSDEKVAILVERYRCGLPLWHEDDEPICRVDGPRWSNPGGA